MSIVDSQFSAVCIAACSFVSSAFIGVVSVKVIIDATITRMTFFFMYYFLLPTNVLHNQRAQKLDAD